MALRNYKPPSREIQLPGNDPIVVRGLSLTDIEQLVRVYKTDFDKIKAHFNNVKSLQDFATLKLSDIVGTFFTVAPSLAAATIAYAGDEPDAAEDAGRLPISVQMEAIEAIGDLTFASEGGPKKVIETVIKMLSGVRGFVNLTSPLPQSQ